MSYKDQINRYGVVPFKTTGPVNVSETLKNFNQRVNSKINLGGGKGEANTITIPQFGCLGGSCSVHNANSNSQKGNTAITIEKSRSEGDQIIGGYKERSYKKKSRKKRVHKKKSRKGKSNKKKSRKGRSYKKKYNKR